MSGTYQYLPLAQIKPGMVLSDELLDKQGQVLLPEGAVLTVPIIALLPRHGIESLPVRCPEQASTEQAAITLNGLQARLARLFRKNDAADTATSALRRYVEDYRNAREAP